MRDLFEWIDQLHWRINILRMHRYLQKVALVFSLFMLVLWVLLGFDSGVGILERWVVSLPKLVSGEMSLEQFWLFGYQVYGRTFHFSSYIIYGVLYVFVSKHLEKLGLIHSLNVFVSGALVFLNVTVFELWYMGSFAVFQMQRCLTEWFLSDILFLQQYFGFLALGVWGVYSVYYMATHYLSVTYDVLSWKTVIVLWFLMMGILLWYYYPFSVETVSLHGWTSTNFFPQTHYAYVNSEVYVRNDMLHAVNVSVKSLFALFQYCLLRDLKNAE